MFGGSMVALVTPMHEDGRVYYASLEGLVDMHIREGTDAIVAVGTTGESATLGFEMHGEFIHWVVRLVDGRIPVIAGTGANATDEALRLTRMAKGSGADACLLVTPYYNKPTQEGLYRHFKKIAEAVDIPQILYNVPGRTACDMLPETVQRLASVENIVGLKEAQGTLERARELVERVGDKIDVFSGEDGSAMESLLTGFKGVISVTANVAPRLMHDMCRAALAGEEAQARELDARLQPLHQALFLESNPIPAKWALYDRGLIQDGIRLPLTPMHPRYHDTVREAMRTAGVIE
jgi:4-hydroxy-tetrahydrodipicolinate synthase